jgi:tetratricopeptide (TPR) repeat protein
MIIEIIGFIRDRSTKSEEMPSNKIDLSTGPRTNVAGDQKNSFSGSFNGPTSAEGNAVDMRVSTGSINEAKGPVSQYFVDNITQIIKQTGEKLIPRIQPPPQNFVGRVADINEILNGFERGEVIVGLQGMGGVGKTALALLLAERLAGRYPDGQILVEMKGTDKKPLSWAEAMIQIIHAYDPEFKMPPNEGELPGQYFSILHGKNALLLLDNAASREQVSPLLLPKNCALLVTSRQKFALPGLTEKDLDVLPMEDAKKLILEICGRIGENAEELAKLCGCLPIALQNAAYALKEKPNLSPEGYIERLGDAKMRRELVDASFSTSYELLAPVLQKLWSLLAVFPADFDLDGAAAVWRMEKKFAVNALSELIKWSLLDFLPSATGEGGRYKLHDLARVFVGSRLSSQSKEVACLRHAKYYRNVLSSAGALYMSGKENAFEGLDLFKYELANINKGFEWVKGRAFQDKSKKTTKATFDHDTALRLLSSYAEDALNLLDLRILSSKLISWLVAELKAARELNEFDHDTALRLLSSYAEDALNLLDLRIPSSKLISWLEAELKAARELNDHEMESKLLFAQGRALKNLGQTKESIILFERCLEITRALKDNRLDHLERLVLSNLAAAYMTQGRDQEACNIHEDVFRKSHEIGDVQVEGKIISCYGFKCESKGDYRKAIEYYEEQLKKARSIGEWGDQERALAKIGNAYRKLGEVHKSIEFQYQALEVVQKIGDPRWIGVIYSNIGSAYFTLNNYDMAIKFAQQSLDNARNIGYKRGEGNALRILSKAYGKKLGKNEISREYSKQSLAIFKEIGDQREETKALIIIGDICRKGKEIKQAINKYQKAKLISHNKLRDKLLEGRSSSGLGKAYIELEKDDMAMMHIKNSLALNSEIGYKRGEGYSLRALSRVLKKIGQNKESIEYSKQSLSIFRDMGNHLEEAKTSIDLGDIYIVEKEVNVAMSYYVDAMKISREMIDDLGEGKALFKIAKALKNNNRTDAIRYAELGLAKLEKIDCMESNSLKKKLKNITQISS